MKFIITESQHNKLWLLRRFNLVEDAFKETVSYVDICRFDSFDHYERRIVMGMMDELHPHFYDIEGFDYDGVYIELRDMFYVEITELYFNRKC